MYVEWDFDLEKMFLLQKVLKKRQYKNNYKSYPLIYLN